MRDDRAREKQKLLDLLVELKLLPDWFPRDARKFRNWPASCTTPSSDFWPPRRPS